MLDVIPALLLWRPGDDVFVLLYAKKAPADPRTGKSALPSQSSALLPRLPLHSTTATCSKPWGHEYSSCSLPSTLTTTGSLTGWRGCHLAPPAVPLGKSLRRQACAFQKKIMFMADAHGRERAASMAGKQRRKGEKSGRQLAAVNKNKADVQLYTEVGCGDGGIPVYLAVQTPKRSEDAEAPQINANLLAGVLQGRNPQSRASCVAS